MDDSIPFFLKNGHIQTIYTSLFRQVPADHFVRERIDTPDGDFIDLDWSKVGSRHLVILSHGLEGNSKRHYMAGMARAWNQAGVDALAWNFRGCSGELNRTKRFYHSGETSDLSFLVDKVAPRYDSILLVGFSLGGNMTMVYLGKKPEVVHPKVRGAAVFSVPVDLAASSDQLAKWSNKVYMHRFISDLGEKMKQKAALYPDDISVENYHEVKTFHQFDERYTARLHGFKSARHYWAECSSKQYIPNIKVPTLIVNTLDDPFLSPECYPYKEAAGNPLVTLETPKHGGHLGFAGWKLNDLNWAEHRAIEFLSPVLTE